MFMAETVEQLGPGGASAVEDKLGWNRGTIRKGQQELETGPIEIIFQREVVKNPKSISLN